MNDFLSIISHQRKLQSALSSVSVSEIDSIIKKLQTIKAKREEEEAFLAQQRQEKQSKVDSLIAQMEQQGISFEDLQSLSALSQNQKSKPKVKRPIKFKLKDNDGNEHTWTGIGRMPKVFATACSNGADIEDFRI